MKCVIASMPSFEASESVRPLIETLRTHASLAVIIPWANEYVPDFGPDVPVITLGNNGLSSAPRWSCRESPIYRNWPEVLYHQVMLARNDSAAFPPVYGDDPAIQRWHGWAIQWRNILRAISPDAVVVHQAVEPVSRIAFLMARSLGIPAAVLESSFLPGKILLDPIGPPMMPGCSWINSTAWLAGTDELLGQLERRSWQSRRITKYPQGGDDSEELADIARLSESGAGGIVLVPDQLPWDAAITCSNGWINDVPELVEAILSCSPNVGVVVKRHPKRPREQYSQKHLCLPDSPRVLLMRRTGLHTLMSNAHIVATVNSTVGLEAAWAGRPVVVSGAAWYTDHCAGSRVTNADDLARHIANPQIPTSGALDRLFAGLTQRYLLTYGDAFGVLERLQLAGKNAPQLVPDPPPAIFAEWHNTVRAVQPVLEANGTLDEAAAIAGFSCADERFRLRSGERQNQSHLAGIRTDHVERYRFAARFLSSGGRFLDASSGVGYGAYILASSSRATGVAVDPSREAIDVGLANFTCDGRVRFSCCSAATLNEIPASFGLVTSFETIEHLPDAARFLTTLWDLVAPGGLLLLSAPNREFAPLENYRFHVRHFDRTELAGLISELGASDIALYGQDSDGSIRVEPGLHWVVVAAKEGTIPTPAPATPTPSQEKATWIPSQFELRGDWLPCASGVRITAPSLGHAIFGPYAHLPPRLWNLAFDLDYECMQAGDELVLEVGTPDGCFLAQRSIPIVGAGSLSQPSLGLTFEALAEAQHEFRVFVKSASGSLIFRSARIVAI